MFLIAVRPKKRPPGQRMAMAGSAFRPRFRATTPSNHSGAGVPAGLRLNERKKATVLQLSAGLGVGKPAGGDHQVEQCLGTSTGWRRLLRKRKRQGRRCVQRRGLLLLCHTAVNAPASRRRRRPDADQSDGESLAVTLQRVRGSINNFRPKASVPTY